MAGGSNKIDIAFTGDPAKLVEAHHKAIAALEGQLDKLRQATRESRSAEKAGADFAAALRQVGGQALGIGSLAAALGTVKSVFTELNALAKESADRFAAATDSMKRLVTVAVDVKGGPQAFEGEIQGYMRSQGLTREQAQDAVFSGVSANLTREERAAAVKAAPFTSSSGLGQYAYSFAASRVAFGREATGDIESFISRNIAAALPSRLDPETIAVQAMVPALSGARLGLSLVEVLSATSLVSPASAEGDEASTWLSRFFDAVIQNPRLRAVVDAAPENEKLIAIIEHLQTMPIRQRERYFPDIRQTRGMALLTEGEGLERFKEILAMTRSHSEGSGWFARAVAHAEQFPELETVRQRRMAEAQTELSMAREALREQAETAMLERARAGLNRDYAAGRTGRADAWLARRALNVIDLLNLDPMNVHSAIAMALMPGGDPRGPFKNGASLSHVEYPQVMKEINELLLKFGSPVNTSRQEMDRGE